MREAHFIDKNKTKWLDIEKNLKNKSKIHPDILSKNYIEIINDLAYAQTYYPKSKTKDYLNELALFAHQSIYAFVTQQLFTGIKHVVACHIEILEDVIAPDSL